MSIAVWLTTLLGSSAICDAAKLQLRGGGRETQTPRRGILPGGPQDQWAPLLYDPHYPFSTVTIDGLDDQWHSFHAVQPQLKVPNEWMQVPNPNHLSSLVPDVIAPEDRWPVVQQESAIDELDGRQAPSLRRSYKPNGGTERYPVTWFMNNSRPVVAPEDSIPQNFYDYFDLVENPRRQNYSNPNGATSGSLDGETDVSARAEKAATSASAAAAHLAKRGGKARRQLRGDEAQLQALDDAAARASGQAQSALDDLRSLQASSHQDRANATRDAFRAPRPGRIFD